MRELQPSGHPAKKPAAYGIDLQAELAQMLEEHGHDILLVYQNQRLHCTCWNYHYQEANHKCPLCLGTGWVIRVEKRKAFCRVGSLPQTLPRAIDSFDMGKVELNTRLYYIGADAKPSASDWIVELQWDSLGRPIPSSMAFYEINTPEPKQSDGGRIQYWRCACENEPSNKDVKAIHLAKSGLVPVYSLVFGGDDRA